MLVRRRNWMYRLAGQRAIHGISFRRPLTTAQAREALRATVGDPVELWGRSARDAVAGEK